VPGLGFRRLPGRYGDGDALGCHVHGSLGHFHASRTIGLDAQGELGPAHGYDQCGGLDLEAGIRIGQRLHATVRLPYFLSQGDGLAAAVLLGIQLDDGDFRIGFQGGRAPIEKDQRSARQRAGADAVSCFHICASGRWLPGLAARRLKFHRAAHLLQGG